MSFSPAAARNAAPIADALTPIFGAGGALLEIGSGTGQHAQYFAERFPALTWQPSDLAPNLPHLEAVVREAALPNLQTPIAFDVIADAWPPGDLDVIYTANTFHIMDERGWPRVLEGASAHLRDGGHLCVYGPMRYRAHALEASNAAFDAALKEMDPSRGIRCADTIIERAAALGLTLLEDLAMPANNRTLIFRRDR